MENKPTLSAKQLAFKAYTHKMDISSQEELIAIEIQFENWWEEIYHKEERKDSFHHQNNVYINGSRYIKAE